MTGSTDGNVAVAQRMIERDPATASRTLRQKAMDLENLHGSLLTLARPIMGQIIELYAAAFQAPGATREQCALLALAMALHDGDMYRDFDARVDAHRRGLSADLLRQVDHGAVLHELQTEGSKS